MCQRLFHVLLKVLKFFIFYLFVPLLLIKIYFVITFNHEKEIQKDGGNFVILDDGRYLEYFVAGDDKNKDIVVYLPGLDMTGKIIKGWLEMNPKLLENHFWVAISHPGWGGSTLQRDRGIDDLPLDVYQVLKALQIEDREVIIYGSSYGGFSVFPFACNPIAEKVNVKLFIMACAAAPMGLLESGQAIPKDLLWSFGGKMAFKLRDLFNRFIPKYSWSSSGVMDECIEDPMMYTFYEDMTRSIKFTKGGSIENMRQYYFDPQFKCSNERIDDIRDKIVLSYGLNDTVCNIDNLGFYLETFGIPFESEKIIKYEGMGHCHCIVHFGDIFLKALELTVP